MKINVPSAARELGPLWAQQLELLQRKGKQTSDFISMLGRVGTEAVMAHATEGASLGMDEGSSKLTRAVGLSSAMDRISGRVGMAESMRSLLLTKSAIEKEEGTKHHLAFLTTLMRDVEGGVPAAAAELDLDLMDIFASADAPQSSTPSTNLPASGPSRSHTAPAALAGSSPPPTEASQAVGKETKPVSQYKARFFNDASDIARRLGIPQESRQVVGEDTKSFLQHEAQPYEDVYAIAMRYGVPPRAIRQANGLSSDDIPVGTLVNIPDATWIQAHQNDPQPSKPLVSHVTQPGEDVYVIAIRYGVPVADLKRLNKLEGDEIAPNTRLKIPRPPQP